MSAADREIEAARRALEERERTAAWASRHGLDTDEAFQLQMELAGHLRTVLRTLDAERAAHAAALADAIGRGKHNSKGDT